MPSDTRPCPCCSGAAYHRKQTAVDDFKEVKCASCDEDGQVAVCPDCMGDGYIETGDKFVEGRDCGGYVAEARHCFSCSATGLDDYTPCDMAKTLENTRERPAKEDF